MNSSYDESLLAFKIRDHDMRTLHQWG